MVSIDTFEQRNKTSLTYIFAFELIIAMAAQLVAFTRICRGQLVACVWTVGHWFPCFLRLDRLQRVSFDEGSGPLVSTNCRPLLGESGWP